MRQGGWLSAAQNQKQSIGRLSGDENEISGLLKGLPLAVAVFEVCARESGNFIDRFVSGADGRAASKTLPIGRYVAKEAQAPEWHRLSTEIMDIEVEFATQISSGRFGATANSSVKIRKTGNCEAMLGLDPLRHQGAAKRLHRAACRLLLARRA